MTNAQTHPAGEAAPTSTGMLNGAGAASVLAAGIGCFMVAVFAILGDKISTFKDFFNFWKATGPLSGVTTSAIVVWLAAWVILHALWRNRSVPIERISTIAIGLLCLSVALTFPPLADLF